MSRLEADPVETFAECARSYCELVESVDDLGRGELVWEAGARLARLYAAGHELPDEATDGELVDYEATAAEKERRDELQSRLSAKLDGVDVGRDDGRPRRGQGRALPRRARRARERDLGVAVASSTPGHQSRPSLAAIHWLTHASGARSVLPDEA